MSTTHEVAPAVAGRLEQASPRPPLGPGLQIEELRRSAPREIWASRELLGNLTQRELRGKYKQSTLGWAWSLINPIAMAAIYTLIFGVLFTGHLKPGGHSGLSAGLTSFPLFLLAGLLPWNLLANGINGSIGSLLGNSNLVKKVYFPREILVISNVLAWDVSLVIELSVLMVAIVLFGSMVLPWIPVVLGLIVLLSVFVAGVGLALSVLNVYFRDVQHFMGIFLQLWFYATPIVYPYSQIAAKSHNLAARHAWAADIHLAVLYKVNPMVGIINDFHAVLFDNTWPVWTDVVYPLAFAVGSLVFGQLLFKKLEPRLAEEL